MSNYIFLHGLELKTKIGVPDFERESFQILHIDVDIELFFGIEMNVEIDSAIEIDIEVVIDI